MAVQMIGAQLCWAAMATNPIQLNSIQIPEDKVKTRTLKPRVQAFLLIACLIAVAVGSGQQAFASPPDIQRFHVDETYEAPSMSAFCGFSIMRHDLLDGRLIVRHSAS